MFRSPLMFWSAVLAASIVTKTQIDHRRAHPVCEPVDTNAILEVTGKPPADGIVVIFGREYPQTKVRAWYEKVRGIYCREGTRISRVSDVVGPPLTYTGFVNALQHGYHFPELGSVGVFSDGEQVLLSHRSFTRKRARAPRCMTRTHID